MFDNPFFGVAAGMEFQDWAHSEAGDAATTPCSGSC